MHLNKYQFKKKNSFLHLTSEPRQKLIEHLSYFHPLVVLWIAELTHWFVCRLCFTWVRYSSPGGQPGIPGFGTEYIFIVTGRRRPVGSSRQGGTISIGDVFQQHHLASAQESRINKLETSRVVETFVCTPSTLLLLHFILRLAAAEVLLSSPCRRKDTNSSEPGGVEGLQTPRINWVKPVNKRRRIHRRVATHAFIRCYSDIVTARRGFSTTATPGRCSASVFCRTRDYSKEAVRGQVSSGRISAIVTHYSIRRSCKKKCKCLTVFFFFFKKYIFPLATWNGSRPPQNREAGINLCSDWSTSSRLPISQGLMTTSGCRNEVHRNRWTSTDIE